MFITATKGIYDFRFNECPFLRSNTCKNNKTVNNKSLNIVKHATTEDLHSW